MKITEIGSVLPNHNWVLVKVHTDGGIVGIGEAYHGAGVHQIAVDQRLTRALIGKDPRNVDRRRADLAAAGRRLSRFHSHLQRLSRRR